MCAMTHCIHWLPQPFRCAVTLSCVPWLIHIHAMTHSDHDSFHTLATSAIQVCRDSFICVPWLMHTYVMTHSDVYHDSFHTLATSAIQVCRDSLIYVPWRIHTYVMTHSYVCHDSFYTLATSAIQVCHDSFMCAMTIQMYTMTHSYVCHDAFICVPWRISCTLRVGEDPHDAWSSRSFFAKEPQNIGLFCWKWPIR